MAGLGAYRMDKREGNWTFDEFKEQIVATRTHGTHGQAFFRMQHLRQFPLLAQFLADDFYRLPALIPPMHRTSAPALEPVSTLRLSQGIEADTLQWQPVDGAVRYAVYASATDSVDTTTPTQLIHTWVADTTLILPPSQYRTLAVTAIDAYRRETAPTYILSPLQREQF